MELFLGILLGLFVLVVLVVLHELGHAVVARRNGVVVEEFGIGFPPRAWKKKLKNGILLSLNWLPLGGFVKLKGEHDSAEGKGTYGGSSYWVKTKILLAGVAINWLTAALLFAVISFWGLPKILPNQVVLPFDSQLNLSPLLVGSVGEGTPAAKAGLKTGDQITEVNNQPIVEASELSATTERLAGQKVEIDYIREGQAKSVEVTLNTEDQAVNGGYLGIGPRQIESVRATWSAPILGLATAGQLTYETIVGLGDILAKAVSGFFGQFIGNEAQKESARQNLTTVSESVAGPIGILGVIFPSVLDAGIIQILLLAAVISLTLAVMNILPIPALDGGRWLIMTIFKVIKRPLTREREEGIQAIGFLVLMILMILVTWSDVGKIF